MALGALAGVPGQGGAGLGDIPFPDASRLKGRPEGAFHPGSEGDQ